MEKRRLRAARLVDQNIPVPEVVRRLGIARQLGYRWHQAWQAGGEAALASKGSAGPKARLTRGQTEQITDALLKGPVAQGYKTQLWTLPRVAALIENLTGIRYHPGHVWRILRELGFSCQRPERRAIERDEQAIRQGRRVKWPALKKARREGRLIVFVDESGLSTRPTRVRTWAPRGQTPLLQETFNWKSLSIIGGLALLHFFFLTLDQPPPTPFTRPGAARFERHPPHYSTAAHTRTMPVRLAHRRRVLWINAVLSGQSLHVIPVLLLRVAVDQSAQRSVGFAHGGIDAQILPAQEAVLAQGLHGQRENLLMNLQPQPLADDRKAGMVGRLLLQRIIEKGPDGQRVGAPRRDGPLAGQVFEETNRDHIQLDDRIDARTARARLIVGRRTQRPHFFGKPKRLQGLVEPRVESRFRGWGQLMSGHPQLALRSFIFLGEHAGFATTTRANFPKRAPLSRLFSTGC